MSDKEKGDARAQGAFQNWLWGLGQEMRGMDRSPEYQAQFWASLRAEMEQFLARKVN